MATIKLSGETEATAGNSSDFLYVIQGGTTKKLQIGNIAGPFTNAITFSGGIKLGSDTLALDRHASGTWTPTIRGSTTQGGPHTYSAQVGRWLRIGDLVFAQIYVVLSALGTAMGGSAQIDGLPFAAENVGSALQTLSLERYYADLSAGYTQLCASISPNASVIQLMMGGDNVAPTLLPVAGVLGTSSFSLAGIYRAA